MAHLGQQRCLGAIFLYKTRESRNIVRIKNDNSNINLKPFGDIPKELLEENSLQFLDALSAKFNEAIKFGEESLDRLNAQVAKNQQRLKRQ